MNKLTLALPLLLAVAACGYTDGGGGTRTLEVIATLEYDASDNETTVDIEVRKDGAAVEAANVVVKDGDSGQTFDIPQQNAGASTRYRLPDMQGYHRKIELRVEKDSDRLDAKLEGPGTHTILDPVNNESVSRKSLGDNMKVEWKVDDGIKADEVTISLDEGDHRSTIKDDPGSYDVPSTALASGDEGVEVTRRNRVKLDGGIGGSKLEISYEAENDIIVTD